MSVARVRILLLFLSLGMASSEIFAHACTIKGGNDAINEDKPGMSSRGWTPRTYIAWCSQCGGKMSGGNCVGYRLDGATTSGAAASTSTGNAAADAAARVINAGNFNTPQNAAMTATAGLATGFAVAAIQGLMAPPSAQQLAQREAARQEQARLQQEAAERRRLEEEEKQRRLLASLRGTGVRIGDLALKRDSSDSGSGNLGLIRRDGQAGVPLTPFGSGSVTPDQAASEGGNLALLRRPGTTPVAAPSALLQLANVAAQSGSGAGAGLNDTAASRASTPFDSGATMVGALPPPPPTPQGKPVGPAFTLEDLNKPGPKPRSEVTAVLKDALEANQGAATAVKQEIARLESGPNRDAAKIAEERAKLERIDGERKSIEEKKKKVDESKEEMVDLSIGDLAGEAMGAGTRTAPVETPATGRQ